MSKSSVEKTDHLLLCCDIARESGTLMFGLSKVLWVKPKTVVHCQHIRMDNLEDLVVVKFGK